MKVECLGSCGTAPVVQMNKEYHESLTKQKFDELLAEFE
jgi:NADH-quinone oxidoreductase subunit E